MAICHFCTGEFGSEQGVKAHMKKCELYQTDKRKKAASLGGLPKAAASPTATPPVHAGPSVSAPDRTAPLADLVKAMHEFSTKQDAPQTPQQKRRQILQAAKAQVIDRYGTPLGQVTASLRGAAKLELERELATLPLENLPFEEVLEIAAAIRDRCYAPAFNRQAQEAEHQNVEHEARRRKEMEEIAASRRADRRKTTLIDQAIDQARARCEAKLIVKWNRLSVLVDIESQLKEFLTGSESVPEAHAIIQTVLDARFAEAAAKQEALQAKTDEQWREEVAAVLVLGAVVGLVVLSFNYPAQTLAIFNWIERTFGYTLGAEDDAPDPEASKTPPPAASAEARPRSTRRRKYSVAPPKPESSWAPSPVEPAQGHA